ncbi:MAG: DotU family type IV/VI secretion system protein [Alphaproteobacteria bacterium]|nr:DotU family type IV/VI secretion system protein [Alphaproteobacteria bacterium]
MLIDSKLAYGSGDDSSFIIRYFEDFYSEIMRHKASILGEEDTQNGTSSKTVPSTDFSPTTPEAILGSLEQLLKTQAIDAARFGGEFATKFYNEAQFVMAALADEVFLHLDWTGKSYWENHLLESRLYNTHNAGQLFFEKMDTFLKNRDPSQADLATLYHLALGLGFKGKFRGIDDQGAIMKYRSQLHLFINHRDPELFKPQAQLFPETYIHTLEDGEIIYLNDFRPWLAFFAAAFAVMMFASYGVWYSATGEIRSSINNILQTRDINS